MIGEQFMKCCHTQLAVFIKERNCKTEKSDSRINKFLVENLPVVTGEMYGKRISVLRDSGSNTVIVRRDLVPDSCLTGQASSVVFVDKTAQQLQEAYVKVHTPYFSGMLLVKCMQDPLYDLVLGNIPGARPPNDPDWKWHPHVDEAKTTPESYQEPAQSSGSSNTAMDSQKLVAVAEIDRLPTGSFNIAEVTRDELKEKQEQDDSLKDCFRKRGTTFTSRSGNHYKYVVDRGLLYRQYHLLSGRSFKQVVVPQPLRNAVLQMAHEGIMAGHQGVRKTTDRILDEFYWPGMHADVKRFVKSCDICQRTAPKGRVGVSPLGSMPLIDTPFRRVAVDLIGPIRPASEKGNKYIITMIDFATRYADGVALPSVDSVHVAEGLLEMFSRVGLPKEIVTDRGRSFTSGLMQEVNRLLSIKSLHTTPYHAMSNGLVERYNGTLKTMLRRMCQEKPRCWDRYLPPLLFAYREVPQASLGFSPFELIYGRHVRGPMTVLRELWTGEAMEEDVRTTYTYLVELRHRLEETCKAAQEELQKAKITQKKYYDRKALSRQLKPGDRVLVLLPSEANKLTMHWKGPFTVVRKRDDLDYEVDLGKKTTLFHVNMLKKYEERKPTSSSVAAINTIEDGIEGEEIPFLPLQQQQSFKDVCISNSLSSSQTQEAQQICEDYREIFSDLPGKTDLVECRLELTSTTPVHVRQYPLPFALEEVIEAEVQDMLRLGVIERSQSPYNAPLLPVKKPDNTIRPCVDYRELNKLLVSDSEPIPRIDVLLARVGPKKFFSKFDFTKGYWQVPMAPDSREKTAFSTKSGLYQFKYMPFGIKTAPAVYARLMRRVFEGVENVYHYFDDVLVATETWPDHIIALKEVFQRIQAAKLTVKPKKCEIGPPTVTFLGHKVGDGMVQPMDKTLDKILGSKRPQTKKEVRSFLGLTGYYRDFIPDYAKIAKPLTELTRKGAKNVIDWNDDNERAFCTLKQNLSSAPILRAADTSKQFVLRTDASDKCLGAVLLQEYNGQLHPVSYASRMLSPRESRYSTVERECLALLWAVRKHNIYLYGKEFILQTDHQPLQYLQTAKHLNNRVLRWSLYLQEYSFTVHYIKGCENVGADFMSRV
ncbi:uncharacterized protein LOC144175419 [Haemaphysalis longicornis]